MVDDELIDLIASADGGEGFPVSFEAAANVAQVLRANRDAVLRSLGGNGYGGQEGFDLYAFPVADA